MSDKEKKQATTAEGAAEPVEKKKPAAKKTTGKTEAAKTAVKVAETAAKVAEAAAKVAKAAAMVAETAQEEPAAKKPVAKKAPAVKKSETEKAPAAKAEKAPAAKKPALEKAPVAKAEKAPAEKKPAAEKTPAAKAEKAPAAKKPAAEKAPAKAADEVAATVDKPAAKAAKKPAADKKPASAKKYSQDARYRLYARYKEEIVPALVSERGYKNVNQAPKLDKIVLNMRLGDIKDNSKSIQTAMNELAQIAGQKPIACKAKKSVANFKVREGMVIGAKVTLRGLNAYEFFDRLVSIALPRVRDFRGVSGKAFDGRGNYALGVKEQIIFPEISYELVEKLRGFDIAVITTARTDDEAKALLTKMGMPFRN